MMFTLVPTAWAEDTEAGTASVPELGNPATEGTSGGIDWSYENGVLTISAAKESESGYGKGQMMDYTDQSKEPVVISTPWYSVKDEITKVVIQNDVTYLGDWAFSYLTNAKEANIPSSIKGLGGYLFRGDGKLTDVAWDKNFVAPTVTDTDRPVDTYTGQYLPVSMFDFCYELGDGIELTDWLPDSFSGVCCASLRGTQFTVNFDAWENLKYIGAYSFSQMPNLNSFTMKTDITYGLRNHGTTDNPQNNSNAFNGSGLKSLEIPEGVTEIFGCMYINCKNLRSISLPSTLKKIGQQAFSDCESLDELVINTTYLEMGWGVFRNCTNLKKLVLKDNITINGTFDSFESVEIYGAVTGNIALSAAKNIVIAGANASTISASKMKAVENLTILGEANLVPYAFLCNTTLKNLTLSNSLGTNTGLFRSSSVETVKYTGTGTFVLADNMFMGCENLKWVDLSSASSVTVEGGCFADDLANNFGGKDENNNGITIPHYINSDCVIYVRDDAVAETVRDSNAGRLPSDKGIVLIVNGGVVNTEAETAGFAAVTKDGYTAKWYEYKSNLTDYSKETAVTEAQPGKTYYAEWNSTITFNANGGTGSMEAQTIAESDTTTPLTTNSFTKTGYTFSGWNTKADGTGTSYTDQATGAGANGNITLYAQWTKKIGESTKYTVNAILDQTYTGAEIKPAVVVKSGDKVLDSGYTVTYSHNTNVGTAKVTVAVGSDKAEVEFNIVKDKNPSVSMADVSVTFGASYTMTATAQTSAGNKIEDGTITIKYYTDAKCTGEGTDTAPTNAGIYYAKATLTGTDNYAVATKIATITISKATFSVSARGYDGTYDGKPHSITVEANGADVTYRETDTGDYTNDKPTYTDAGEYTVYYKATKPNHDEVTGSAKVKIAKVQTSLTLTADPANMTGAGTVNLTVASTGIPETATISAPTCEGVTVSTNPDGTYSVSLPNETKDYTFTVSYADDGNHEAATATCTVSVTRYTSVPGAPTYPATAPAAPNGTVTVTPSNASKGTNVTVTVKPNEGYELGSLAVKDASGNLLPLADLGNGKFSFVMPASKVSVEAEFVKTAATSFADVPANAYFADAVKWAVDKGITNGLSDTMFGPYESCTRAQIVTFLWRAAGSPEPKTASSFTDVPANAYYAKAVAWAVENGITNGMTETTFAPDATCTRGQSVTFLHRALKGTASGSANFTDVKPDAFYADAVNWAVASDVTNGTSNTTFSPNADCTRADIVTFLYRAYQGK